MKRTIFIIATVINASYPPVEAQSTQAIQTSSLYSVLSTMLLKSVFIANAIAGAVASPASLHKRQDVNSYIEAEKPIALQGVLNNFGPNGNLSRGAAPGVSIAGNSETNPPCMLS